LSIHDDLVITDPKSIFILVDQKIEQDSIYDNQPKSLAKNRFG
jgi:hypothetical protein